MSELIRALTELSNNCTLEHYQILVKSDEALNFLIKF